MVFALAGGAVMGALSLLLGFAARRTVTRPARQNPATGNRPAGNQLAEMPATGNAETRLSLRWPALARTLLRPDRFAVAVAIWLALLDVVLSLAAPWPLKVVIDYALGHQPFPTWLAPLAGLHPVSVAVIAAVAGLLLLAASAVAGYLVTVLTAAAGEQMTVRLRAVVTGRLLRAEPKAAAAFPLGELTNRLGGDTMRVSDTVTATLDTLLPDTVLLAGMTVITAALDWRLTVVSVAVIPLYALTARVRNHGLRVAQRQARDRAGELATFATGLLARLPAVHVFDRAAAEADRYHAASAASAEAEVAAVNASARFGPVTDTLPGLALAAALITGTVEVTSGRLTLGGLLVFLAYLSSLTSPVRSLTRLSATIARGTASRDRLAELLSLPLLGPAAASAGDTVPGAPLRTGHRGPEVTLDRVSYAHRAGEPVLDMATMGFPAGTLTALTGRSGTGKSTLLSLLIRLADPQSGLIAIDGQDITRLPLPRLRDLVTLVPQEPWLHDGTIAENIGYGRHDATARQVRDAAERAGVAAFADTLPDGFDTPVGEHGHQLSGGQQRRVAIARALLRDTPVLLLDEPTTGLDPETESLLVTQLLAATAGKTVILVTHQPALVGHAAHVVQLASGRMSKAGSYGKPVAAGG
ncbi:ABC transporter ATP-binding protein [Trebonia kvetii]|uniref:ABC transporter ATP-binding protein n=1 Tax=Trebonia kvetii TaxID=2480626 RepID=A0A6P2BV18_9ACTN|nr:ABC transporter ATP-binding protein [Trebonia kvetii]TVZ02952.1 ABC transporter ATP-binding protein [Trebonia kvetii]